jgi:hypothetical protein
MDVKEAVNIAKNTISELFNDVMISDPSLEEVEHDTANDVWKITVGFLRGETQTKLIAGFQPTLQHVRRTYKVVNIANDNRILSVKDRELPQ